DIAVGIKNAGSAVRRGHEARQLHARERAGKCSRKMRVVFSPPQLRQIIVKKAAVADDAHIVLGRSEEHTSELQSRFDLVCRLLLEKKKQTKPKKTPIAPNQK